MKDKNSDERKKRINYIFDILQKNDCENLTLQYSGGGDDGQMEIYDHDLGHKIKTSLDEPTIFASMYYGDGNLDLYHLIEEVSENLLNQLGVDWVNGIGSSGQIFFDTKNKSVTVGYQVFEDKEAVFTE